MKDYLTNFPFAKLSVYATVIVIFSYNVLLERDMACPCRSAASECSVHMVLPSFIIFFLILWMNKKFLRTWKYSCTCRCQLTATDCKAGAKQCCCGTFSLVLVRHIFKAFLVGLLWVSSVLIDGDWYVCCGNDGSEQQLQLPCKDQSSLSPQERKIISELKIVSKIIGFAMLFCIVMLAAIMSLFKWRKCCEGISRCCDRRVHIDKLILEQEEKVLEEILREKIKVSLAKEIEANFSTTEWRNCFDAAHRLINKPIDNFNNVQQHQDHQSETHQQQGEEMEMSLLLDRQKQASSHPNKC